MSENKINILSTRILKKELLRRADLQHIETDAVAFIQNIPDVADTLSGELQQLAATGIVAVFTSIHAVEVVKSELSGRQLSWKICCTGGATKEALLELFDESAIIAAAKNASGLADKILQYGSINEVYFFCSKQRLNDLPETLSAAGVKVREMNVYQTVGTPVIIQKQYQGILFFSPSGVHSFFSVNTIPVNTILFSIGKTTTATIESYCSNEVVTSQWPGEANLLELVIERFGKTTELQSEQ
ncbi:MAG: uroporphyrinogen-III synthase [Chitinophagaceae bacterium]|nr:uroporphyrinogen-III synthase [Chitinophagaceae bacterium]